MVKPPGNDAGFAAYYILVNLIDILAESVVIDKADLATRLGKTADELGKSSYSYGEKIATFLTKDFIPDLRRG